MSAEYPKDGKEQRGNRQEGGDSGIEDAKKQFGEQGGKVGDGISFGSAEGPSQSHRGKSRDGSI